MAIDPVCGMTVEPETAAASARHKGTTYYFCHPHCKSKFQAEPQRYLKKSTSTPPLPPPPPQEGAEYFCPMCPGVTSSQPGPCPRCGMPLEARHAAESLDANSEWLGMRRRFWIGLVLLLPLLVLAMGEMLFGVRVIGPPWNGWFQLVLASVIVFGCGAPFFARAWRSLWPFQPNMFTLIALGVGTAYIYSVLAVIVPQRFPAGFAHHDGVIEPYFESAATIVVLVLLGQVLEGRARHATGAAIRKLAGLAPKTARIVLSSGAEEEVPIERIEPGTVVRIRPGEKVPVDGVVLEGVSEIDEAMITGEPIPAAKDVGDRVIGGSINGTGTLLVRAEHRGSDSLLSQMIRMVEEAQRSRAPIQTLVDRVSAVFVPAVLAAALLTFVGWSIWGGASGPARGLLNAVAVLIIACPCALGLATPLALTVGIGRAAQAGVLIRNAEALETFHKAQLLIVDKTGTLTEGKPRVRRIIPHGDVTAENLVRWAASLEQGSEHPLASALLLAAKEKGLSLESVSDFRALPGKGIEATLGSVRYRLGKVSWLKEEGTDVSPIERSLNEEEPGEMILALARERALAGYFTLADPIRATTPEALARLRAQGLEILLLTGDREPVARRVARELGITHFEAEVLPDHKQRVVREWRQQGMIVAMAGDGINDAPALAEADVGIAMGTGADIAMHSAGIVLVRGDLRGIADARSLSHATVRILRGNLLLAFLYNTLSIPIAALGYLDPILAGAAMSLSSLSVVINSLRLRG